MQAFRGAAHGLVTFLGAVGVLLLFVAVLVLLPLFVAGVVVDYMIYRPAREADIVDRLYDIEMQLISLGGTVQR